MNSKPTRRTFFSHAGAALTAPLAAMAAVGGEREVENGLAARLAALEDLHAVRALQQRYVRLVNAGARVDLAALFAEPARAALDETIRTVTLRPDDALEVAAGATATLRVACTVEIATPLESCGTLVEMARLQGDGIVKRSEARVLESSFVKRDGIWKIEHAEFLA
jgi:hypothetical protein